jgi:hypothetical protein
MIWVTGLSWSPQGAKRMTKVFIDIYSRRELLFTLVDYRRLWNA